MSYFGQFQRFSPLSALVPGVYFSKLPDIAYRARRLLKPRSIVEIENIAKSIDFAIYCYFEELKENEITRLRQILQLPRRWKDEPDDDFRYAESFFDWDGGTEGNGRWLFKESMEDRLEIPTSHNTSEFEALLELMDCWDELGEGVADFKSSELFATLALWKVSDVISCIDQAETEKSLSNLGKDFHQMITNMGVKLPPYFQSDFKIAAEYALVAMESICYAERLEALLDLSSNFINQETKKLEEGVRKFKSNFAKSNAFRRHAETYQLKTEVIKHWSENIDSTLSNEKAAELLKKHFPLSHRKLSEYVSEAKRNKGE